MQVATSFIKDLWGEENFSLAIACSTGFGLATKSVVGALSYEGSPNVRRLCDLTLSNLHQAIEARREFRLTMIASFAVAAWSLSEVVLYTITGLVTLVVFQDKKFLTLAGRSIVQLCANSFYAVIGFVGQFSPTFAVKAYAKALELLVMVQPDTLRIYKEQFSRNLDNLSGRLVQALGKREEDVAAVSENLGQAK